MLYLDAPIGPIEGLTLYRDHQDPDLFFYASERPRIALNDGVPEFVYLKYKRDITDNPNFDPETKQSLGGGFLAFTVDLGVTDEQLKKVKQEVARFADGEVKLAPIQFRKGSVRLSISEDAAKAPGAAPDEPRGFRFFEKVYGATMPSLFGFNRATFSVVLDQEAATLFEEALKAGVSPIGVIYDLEFLGLRPAFNVRITAEYHRIYDHLEMSFGARAQIQVVSLAAEIDLAFQKLRDEGAIKVEVLNFTDDDNLRNQANAAFDWFKTELLRDFFKSALQPPSFMNQSASGGLMGQLQSLFGNLANPQTGSSQPTRGTPAANPNNGAEGARTLQEGAPSTASDRPAASGGGNANGGSNMAPFQIAFSLKYYRQDELKTRVFEYSMQSAVAREIAPQGLFTTIMEGLDLSRMVKEVNLDDDFFKRMVTTVSMGGDLTAAGISSVAFNLEYPAQRKPNQPPLYVDGAVFRPDELTPKTFTSWLDDKKHLDYRYQLDVNFKPDSPWIGKETQLKTDWNTSSARQLTIDPLSEIGLFDLEVSFGEIDDSEIAQAQVELIYEDKTNLFKAQKTFVLKPGEASQHWRLRLSDPEQKAYQYRITYFLQNNVRIETAWQSSEAPSLVVNEPFQGKLDIRLTPLLDPNTIVESVVDITYEERDTGYKRRFQETFSSDTADGLKRRTLSIPTLSGNPLGYRYEFTVVRTDGSVFQSDSIDSDSSVLVISDGVGTTHRIKVKPTGASLAQAGLLALKVDLIGEGDDPDRESAIFTASQMEDKVVALVQPDADHNFVYSYKVTGYDLQGRAIAGASGTTSDTTLFVPVPTP